jgi:hypothetical protein
MLRLEPRSSWHPFGVVVVVVVVVIMVSAHVVGLLMVPQCVEVKDVWSR